MVHYALDYYVVELYSQKIAKLHEKQLAEQVARLYKKQLKDKQVIFLHM